MIGHLQNKASAAAFSDYLYVNGISNVIEAEKDGYGVWIHAEDELPKARDLLSTFQRNPDDPTYAQHSRQANELKQRADQEERAAGRRHFDRDRIFRATWLGAGPVTLVLILLSVAATVALTFGWKDHILRFSLYMSGAPEIRKGELWRLITPIFLHAPLLDPARFLHLPFNMIMLFQLGGIVEQRRGSLRYLVLALALATLSNLAEYKFGSPYFGGISGVLYGLFGYAWIRGRLDPESGLQLNPQAVMMLLIWFFLCWFVIPGIANIAHTAGLILGMAWGFLSTLVRSRS